MTRRQHAGERDVVRDRGAGVDVLEQLAGRDQRRGAAARAVEERDHLRHRGHLHGARRIDADDRADQHRRADDDPVDDPLRERRDDRDQHADHEIRLPSRAVFGELRKRSPRMKRIPVTRYAMSTGFAGGFGGIHVRCPRGGGVCARPEHREHPFRHRVAAEDVQRREQDEDEAGDRAERRVRGSRDEDRADQHDAVDRVGRRHQRRVQRRRDLRDHLEADEDGEDEDRQLGEQMNGHAAPPVSAARVGACTTSPSRVIVVPATISSVGSSASAPSLMM